MTGKSALYLTYKSIVRGTFSAGEKKEDAPCRNETTHFAVN